MIKIYPAKEVTACADCPACMESIYCNRLGQYIDDKIYPNEEIHPLCPLQTKEQA